MQERYDAVLSIAGYDPSGGAGVLADIKTFEQLGVQGMAVTTCITYQNDIAFNGLSWLSFEEIERQYKVLCERFNFPYVKIGLVKDLDILSQIISMLKRSQPDVKIIWDPILKASAGFVFHDEIDRQKLLEVLSDVYLATPNYEEAKALSNGLNPLIYFQNLSTNTLIKSYPGTDASGDAASDMLISNKDTFTFTNRLIAGAAKHGSGCVLSSAITAFLSKGQLLPEACRNGKDYTLAYLASAPGLLGFHKDIAIEENMIN